MKVLIATDGSTFSQTAVKEWCRFVDKTEVAAIKIVSVYSAVLPVDTFAPSVEYAEELENAQKMQAVDFAEKAAAEVRVCFPGSEPDLTTKIVIGNPPQVIVETAKEWSADLIVIGSHGRGFWKRMLLGSVTDAVVHHASCSVLVIRQTKELSKNTLLE
jgi:nucleotide-binding universal stress UspA family protein